MGENLTRERVLDWLDKLIDNNEERVKLATLEESIVTACLNSKRIQLYKGIKKIAELIGSPLKAEKIKNDTEDYEEVSFKYCDYEFLEVCYEDEEDYL